MNEENNNVVSNIGAVDNDNTEIEKEDTINNSEINNPKHEDVSKVKIRTILKQRFKKLSPILKKVIPLVIVGIICFGAGLIAGKEIDRHSNGRILMNRKGMYRQMPYGKFNGGNFNKKQFNNKNSQQQQQQNNNSQKQQNQNNNTTPQATPPATNNSQSQ